MHLFVACHALSWYEPTTFKEAFNFYRALLYEEASSHEDVLEPSRLTCGI